MSQPLLCEFSIQSRVQYLESLITANGSNSSPTKCKLTDLTILNNSKDVQTHGPKIVY
jgi:hypothetical protein